MNSKELDDKILEIANKYIENGLHAEIKKIGPTRYLEFQYYEEDEKIISNTFKKVLDEIEKKLKIRVYIVKITVPKPKPKVKKYNIIYTLINKFINSIKEIIWK